MRQLDADGAVGVVALRLREQALAHRVARDMESLAQLRELLV